MPWGESVGSVAFKLDACMRQEGVKSDKNLLSDATIISECTLALSMVMGCGLMSIGSSFLVPQAIS